MYDPRAIIDIGSNTVRMVIYGGPPRAPVVLFNEKVTAKLGKGVAENGRLSAKSMAAALAALRRYAALLRLKTVSDWQCVATAAVCGLGGGLSPRGIKDTSTTSRLGSPRSQMSKQR